MSVTIHTGDCRCALPDPVEDVTVMPLGIEVAHPDWCCKCDQTIAAASSTSIRGEPLPNSDRNGSGKNG